MERKDQWTHCLSSALPSNICSPYLAQILTTHLFVELWSSCPQAFHTFTADYRETYTTTSQFLKNWAALLFDHPKSKISAFPGLCMNMLPDPPTAVLLHSGGWWPVLPLATDTGRHKPALIQELAGTCTRASQLPSTYF